jgi:hypothetical protein
MAIVNDPVEDNIGPIFAVGPHKTLRITLVLGGSVRNGNLDTIAAAPIRFRPEFGGSFYTKYVTPIVEDSAPAVGNDRIPGTVNLEERHRGFWMEPSGKRDRDRTNRRKNVRSMSG